MVKVLVNYDNRICCPLSVALTHKQLETNAYIISTVATDAMVLKHQAISIYNADGLAQDIFCTEPVLYKRLFLKWIMLEIKIISLRKLLSCLSDNLWMCIIFVFSVKGNHTMIVRTSGLWAVFCMRWLVCRKPLRDPTSLPWSTKLWR